MRYSGIGGQAVMEGVMMKNGDKYAVAVRKPDGEIIVETKEYRGILADIGIRKLPFIRGVINFVDSLALGMRTLAYSASFYEEEEPKQVASDRAGKESSTFCEFGKDSGGSDLEEQERMTSDKAAGRNRLSWGLQWHVL